MTVELGFAALLGNCLKITMEGTILLVSTGVPGIPSLTHLCWAPDKALDGGVIITCAHGWQKR